MSKSGRGGFFAIGSNEFSQACELGMNPAITLLVMARGSGRDNSTTSWSALSVFNHTGMARRRAKESIEALLNIGVLEIIKGGDHPRYKLCKPEDERSLLWLPNELISGAGNEVPPVRKLRETGNLPLLQKFIELYGLQDLDNDGGLPRSIACSSYERKKICNTGPQLTLYGFNFIEARASNHGIFHEYDGKKDQDNNKGAWIILSPLEDFGLIEHVIYMAESAGLDAELIYPLTQQVVQEHRDLTFWLEEKGGTGFARDAEMYDHIAAAPKHISNATMVGLYRLRYRPKTGKTARWLALRSESEQAVIGLIGQILRS